MPPKFHTGILDAEIPFGGLGRPLTAEERKKLISAGVSCGERHIVVRVAITTPRLGRLYKPTYAPERHAPMDVFLA